MSDREWIDRARSSRPEDLSSGDVGRLRDEARRSPELRKALADEIRLDQALHAATGRSPLSTSKIVAHVTAAAAAAGAASAAGGGILGGVFGWLSVLVVTATVGVVTVLVVPEPGASPKCDLLSPEKSAIIESPAAPNEDHRFIDAADGTSPSDKLPAIPQHPDELHPDPTKPPAAADKSSVAEKHSASKVEHGAAEAVPMPRGKGGAEVGTPRK